MTVLAIAIVSARSEAFFVALDPNALDLNFRAAHEELTRQSYRQLQESWKTAGGPDATPLESAFDALYNLTSGVYATDVPNGDYPVSLPEFWKFPTDIIQWHNNPEGQHLHSLRNRRADDGGLEFAIDACRGTRKSILTALSKAFDQLAAGEASKYLFLAGHGLHMIQDSFSPAHALRQTSGNYNLVDICYYGKRVPGVTSCYHEENDHRDHLWLLQDMTNSIALTTREWKSRGETVKSLESLESFILSDASESDKVAYLKHEARLAKVASIKYLNITLKTLLALPKAELARPTAFQARKKAFLEEMTRLLEGKIKNSSGPFSEVMPEGILNCSQLNKKEKI
jgi:hypothetical protein